jgi:DNA-directed RNA polymerase subunit RPC12/RpoP
MTNVSNEEQSNNANVLLVDVADMLQYTETQWVTSCDKCGAEHWFELPQEGDKVECDCGAILVVSNSN